MAFSLWHGPCSSSAGHAEHHHGHCILSSLSLVVLWPLTLVQGDKEREAGMPVTPLCDREKAIPVKGQHVSSTAAAAAAAAVLSCLRGHGLWELGMKRCCLLWTSSLIGATL